MASVSFAGVARYLYDAEGRLWREVAMDGSVIEYVYDSLGNLMAVNATMMSTSSPSGVSITPDLYVQGAMYTVSIAGSGLDGLTRVTCDNPGIVARLLSRSEDTVVIEVEVEGGTVPGQVTFRLESPFGVGAADAYVHSVHVEPTYIVLSPSETAEVRVWIDPDGPHSATVPIYSDNSGAVSLSMGEVVVPASSFGVAELRAEAAGRSLLNFGKAMVMVYVAVLPPADYAISSRSISIGDTNALGGAIIARSVSVRGNRFLNFLNGSMVSTPVSIGGNPLADAAILSRAISIGGNPLADGVMVSRRVSVGTIPLWDGVVVSQLVSIGTSP